jgi:secondary thiamine-phosphate synthase enzyme
MVRNYFINVRARGYCDVIDISQEVFDKIAESNIRNGSVLLFCPGSTSGITTIEYESGVVSDLKAYFQRAIPEGIVYRHNLKWGDGNGFSHVRSANLKPSFTFPIVDGRPYLGTWQQLVFVDFDNRDRQREILVQISGE